MAAPSPPATVPAITPDTEASTNPAQEAPTHPDPAHPYQDTQVDGDVTLDDAGQFVPDRRAIQLFDYFFIESGRLSDEEILQQIQDWLASRLTEPALSAAQAFLAQYLTLRQLAAAAAAKGELPADPAARLQLIESLQRQAFGTALAAKLFGEENRLHSARLARMQAQAAGEPVDPTAGLNAAETRVYQRTQAVLQASAIDATTANAEERWQQRSEAYGYDAADRLGELDRQRAEWQGRVTNYLEQKAALANDETLDPAEREARAQALLEDMFDPTEQLRVQAQERLAQKATAR